MLFLTIELVIDCPTNPATLSVPSTFVVLKELLTVDALLNSPTNPPTF